MMMPAMQQMQNAFQADGSVQWLITSATTADAATAHDAHRTSACTNCQPVLLCSGYFEQLLLLHAAAKPACIATNRSFRQAQKKKKK
jgi:hypothetical protein